MTVLSGSRVRRRPWLILLGLLTVSFLAYSLPPYLGFDPSQSRAPIRADVPGYYALLVIHILCGGLALVTACLQLSARLRRRRPQVHRWSGRLYFACVLPAAIAVIVISPFAGLSLSQRVSNTLLAVLWLATTVAGYRAASQRRYRDHGEWMVRSVALAFSIISTRVWFAVWSLLTAQEVPTDRTVGDQDLTVQVFAVSDWLGWVVNLLVAEWWLNRRRRRPLALAGI